MINPRQSKTRKKALKAGFRSAFEQNVYNDLTRAKVEFEYEPKDRQLVYYNKIKDAMCLKCLNCDIIQKHLYLPDFFIEKRNTVLETKGRFTAQDRKKMLLVKENNPSIRIVMLFMTNGKVTKKARYLDWCERYKIEGYLYTDKNWISKIKNK